MTVYSAQAVAVAIGTGGSGGENWAAGAKAAVTTGTCNDAHRLGSGSIRARHWQELVQTGARVGSGNDYGRW